MTGVPGRKEFYTTCKIVLVGCDTSCQSLSVASERHNLNRTTEMKRLKKIATQLAAYEGKPVKVIDATSHRVRFAMDKQDGNIREVSLFRRNSDDSKPVQMQLGNGEEVHSYEEEILPRSLVAAMAADPLAAALLAAWREQNPTRQVIGSKEFRVDSYSLADLNGDPSKPARWTIIYPFESAADVGIYRLPAPVKAEFEAWTAESPAVKKAFSLAK